MNAAGEVFWVRQGAAGFDGPGRFASGRDGQSDARQVRVSWSEGLDLGFDEASSASAGALGNLRQATFRGNVRASDPQQTMWSDRLAVTFVEPDDRAGTATTVDEVTADGNVQVLLSDGARVFADRLHGNAARETVALTGADVAIANKQWLIDEGREITLDKASGVPVFRTCAGDPGESTR